MMSHIYCLILILISIFPNFVFAQCQGKWIELEENPNCAAWMIECSSAGEQVAAVWTGGCNKGTISGNGILQFYQIFSKDIILRPNSRRKNKKSISKLFLYELEGFFVDGKLTKNGFWRNTTGPEFEGFFVKGNPIGKGVLRWIDPFTGGKVTLNIQGENFSKNIITGKGVLIYPDGTKYVGDFKNWRRSGKGSLTWPGGTKFRGNFVDGVPSGQGEITWIDGRKYIGAINKGKISGKGTLTWPNGAKYEGEFANYKRHGEGTMIWPDGTIYKGSFIEGDFGQGTLNLKNGKQLQADIFGDIGDWIKKADKAMSSLSINQQAGIVLGAIGAATIFGGIKYFKWINSNSTGGGSYSQQDYERDEIQRKNKKILDKNERERKWATKEFKRKCMDLYWDCINSCKNLDKTQKWGKYSDYNTCRNECKKIKRECD